MDALRGIDPQTGFRILRDGITPALGYLIQITPPHITVPILESYDDHIIQTAMDLLHPSEIGDPLKKPPKRFRNISVRAKPYPDFENLVFASSGRKIRTYAII